MTKKLSLTGADYSTPAAGAGQAGEAFGYAYDPVGNPVSLRSRDELPHRPDAHPDLDHGDQLYL
jgi:hypothetical protein